MKPEEFIELFEKHNEEEFLEFDKIEKKPFNSPDLCAFGMIYNLLKKRYKNQDLIRSAEHDEIYLPGLDELDLEEITEDMIIYLIRCGVRYDEDCENLCMFV